MKPLCFVLMPFRRKTDERGRSIDFDAIYTEMIAPAVAAAGLDVIRADEEQIGGAIHKPMFERLQLCEYAIADVTTANPNVYYELGIRHAMKPRSTVIISASGTVLPFDIALLRGIHYEMDELGALTSPSAGATAITKRLQALQKDERDDSPVFQFLAGLPRPKVDHEATDLFRERAEYSKTFKDRLAAAREKGGVKALRAIAAEPELDNLEEVEGGIVIDLYLSYRDVKAYDEMLALYDRMPVPIQRTRMIQEQRGFALNRMGRRSEAIAVLEAVIKDFGPSGETSGLLGRVHKDLYQAAEAAKEKIRAKGQLDRAIETYVAGFETDWRDPYPGINALTLMQLVDEPDPREAQIAPVVLYAAKQRVRQPSANYWDFATVLETAVIADDVKAVASILPDVVTRVEHGWWATTTAANLELIRGKREAQGREAGYIAEVIEELRRAAAAREPSPATKSAKRGRTPARRGG